MSEATEREKLQGASPPMAKPFRFECFADALSAQAGFDAAYPRGSPVELALRALIEMGAQCKTLNAMRVACRYVENDTMLVDRCWYVSLGCDREKAIQQEIGRASCRERVRRQ